MAMNVTVMRSVSDLLGTCQGTDGPVKLPGRLLPWGRDGTGRGMAGQVARVRPERVGPGPKGDGRPRPGSDLVSPIRPPHHRCRSGA